MSSVAGKLLLTIAIMAALSTGAVAGREEVVEKTFDARESVRINTVSGDCIVDRSSDDKIHVRLVYSYSPRGSFEPEFIERGRVLRLNENHYESNSGSSVWTVSVPPETRVRFSTASGDFEATGLTADINVETASGDAFIEDCKGQFELESASGDITAEDCEGEFEFNTASGDITLENCSGQSDLQSASGDIEIDECEGEFDTGTASGDIEAVEITLNGSSGFESASGDAEVSLAAGLDYDLVVSSASGSAILDFNGHPLRGQFEFTARLRRGRIISPIDFDVEEEFERWGEDYVSKSFTKNGDSPFIAIETASGEAILKE